MGGYRPWVAVCLLLGLACADQPNFHDYHEYSQHGDAPSQKFKSADILAPLWNIDVWNEQRIDFDASHIFFSAGDGNSGGPYIFSSKDLSLVYADRNYDASNNARVQQYKNETYFTFWEGAQTKGHAEGRCHIVNKYYEKVHSLKGVNTVATTDLHECQLTKDGTALITIYETTPFDLSEIGGEVEDKMLDSVFQEIDIETGELLFEWRGSQHIPVTESYKPYEAAPEIGWDAYHINCLQKDAEGNYYVSLRRLHALVKINGTDGSRIWQLGGKENDFEDLSDGHATDFAWQHHMRFIDDAMTELTMFDNHNLQGEREVNCVGEPCSRGSRIRLNYEDMTAKLLQNFYSPTGFIAYAMGGYDTTPNGNALIGWGSHAEITEFSPEGVPVMNVQFGKLGTWMRTYRVYKGRWEAYPPWPPGIAIDGLGENRRLFVSWNGATEVTHWVVTAAQEKSHLEDITFSRPLPDTLTPRKGFEVEINYKGEERFVRIAALDKEGMVLGASGIMDVQERKVAPVDRKIKLGEVYYNKEDGAFSNSLKP